jgi:hypothetical protein
MPWLQAEQPNIHWGRSELTLINSQDKAVKAKSQLAQPKSKGELL